jgi:hypothetical protein
MPPPATRPIGLPTRGKTARGRLRRIDAFVALYDPGLLRRRDGPWAEALFVDLGYGFEPWTTLEAAERFRRLRPDLRVLGVEIDPDRVAAAQVYAEGRTSFRRGGFNLPLGTDASGGRESVRLIRAVNVLRQYDEVAVAPAVERLGASLLPGGLLVEGTSDPEGRAFVATLLRRPTEGADGSELRLEGVVFGTRLRAGFDPADFQPILPKRYIHRMVPGEPIHALFSAWRAAWQACLPERVWGARRLFVATAEQLARQDGAVHAPRRLTRRGYLVWRPEGAATPRA